MEDDKEKFDNLVLSYNAHSRDMNWFSFVKDGKVIHEEDSCYVPDFIGGGDDVVLKIDVETGQILNWDKDAVKEYIAEQIDTEN